MTAIDDLFTRLRASDKKALMPFITAGDPNLPFTSKVLLRLQELGCSMAEVGIPYSDPIADGPVIQASYTRALANKVKLDQIFHQIAGTQPSLSMPLVSTLSARHRSHGPSNSQTLPQAPMPLYTFKGLKAVLIFVGKIRAVAWRPFRCC